jgi:Fe-S cluster assembly protein SufD
MHKDWYINNFKLFEQSLNGESKSKLQLFRQAAISKFGELEFPTTKNEEWRYTSLSDVLNYQFTPSCLEKTSIEKLKLAQFPAEYQNKNVLVFINGILSKEFSKFSSLNSKITANSIEKISSSDNEVFEQHFGKYSNYDNGFNALNSAFIKDGAFIFIPDNQIIEEPIYLIYLNGKNDVNILSQPRNLFVLGKNSQANFIEIHQPISESPYLTNTLSEIIINENSILDHHKIQNESLTSYHISKIQVEQRENSKYTSHNISLGGALTRNDINSVLNGKGCEANYFGLYFVGGNQHVDNHTLVDHATPHCFSNEFYKGILADESKGVFNGKIVVRKDAQKTNAYQSNKNLLLSGNARIDTKPQLEIFADDVRCTHGATVGQIDEEALYYLRARGIQEDNARSLLVNAFASDVLDFIKNDELKSKINEVVFKKLKHLLSGKRK